MALTPEQRQQIKDNVTQNIKKTKDGLTALTNITDDKFFEMLEKLISTESILNGKCDNDHFQSLYNLLLHPDRIISNIADNDLAEAQQYVKTVIANYIRSYKEQVAETARAAAQQHEAARQKAYEQRQKPWYWSYAISKKAFNKNNELIGITKTTAIVPYRDRVRDINDYADLTDDEKLKLEIKKPLTDIVIKSEEFIQVIFKFDNFEAFKRFHAPTLNRGVLAPNRESLCDVKTFYTPIHPYKSFSVIPTYNQENPDLNMCLTHDGEKLISTLREEDYSITYEISSLNAINAYISTQMSRLEVSSDKYQRFNTINTEISLYKDDLIRRFNDDASVAVDIISIINLIRSYKTTVRNIASEHRSSGLEYALKLNFWRNPQSLNEFDKTFPEVLEERQSLFRYK